MPMLAFAEEIHKMQATAQRGNPAHGRTLT